MNDLTILRIFVKKYLALLPFAVGVVWLVMGLTGQKFNVVLICVGVVFLFAAMAQAVSARRKQRDAHLNLSTQSRNLKMKLIV